MDRYGDYDDDDRGSRQRNSSNKSTLMVLGIGAAVLGVCLLICGGLFYLGLRMFRDGMANFGTAIQQAAEQAQQMQGMQDAESTAEAFLQDIAGGQVDSAYARTSKDFQARQTPPQFRAFVNQNPALQKYEGDSLDQLKFAPPSATFTGMVPGPNGDITFTLVVVKDGQAWKVDRFTIP
jgi:hypothetical protein